MQRCHRHLADLLVGNFLSENANRVTPNRADAALEHAARRMVAEVLVGGAHLLAHAAEAPGLVAAGSQAFLPVLYVKWRQLDRDRRLRSEQAFNSIYWIPTSNKLRTISTVSY